MNRYLILFLVLVPAVLTAQQRSRKPVGPNRYDFIQDQAGKDKFVFDNNSGNLWKLVIDKESGEPLLKQVLKEDASIIKLKQDKMAMKEEKTLFEKKYKLSVMRADSVTKEMTKVKEKMAKLEKQVAADTSATLRKVWKSPFYIKAAEGQKNTIDSLIVNNHYKITKKDLKALKSKVKAKEAKKIDQAVEKRIIKVIEKYCKFPN